MTGAPAQTCLGSVDVLVLAGGLGTRLQGTLGDTPKLLAPIAGRPYLAYLLDWLCHFGAKRVVLGLGHRGDAVLGYVAHKSFPDLAVVTVREPEPLGTAGAIRFARAKLQSDPVLVLNGDSFVDADLCAMLARHREKAAIGTILCTEVDEAGRYGRVDIDNSAHITGFREKDPNFAGPALISAGVYLLSAQLLDQIAVGEASSLERDVFEVMPGRSLVAMAGRYPFIDIGTPESLARAQEFLALASRSQIRDEAVP